MKSYADYPHASVSMSKDQLFLDSVNAVIRDYQINTIIESGTFLGLGSTTTLAEALINNNAKDIHFYTLEVDSNLYSKASKNLKRFSFITPVWGISVSEEAAKDFIDRDEALANHEKYPDVYIDDTKNPKQFYLNELSGNLSKQKGYNPMRSLQNLFSNNRPTFKEDVFSELLPQMPATGTLILLDSAGGIGYLEFLTVVKEMRNKEYVIILDDIHHLKHFRSLADIKKSPAFTIIAENSKNGWVIAAHKPV